MAYLIGEGCTAKEHACADACPVECIYPKKRVSAGSKLALYINAEECIDCGACALACPENAIISIPGRGWYATDRPLAVREEEPELRALVGATLPSENVVPKPEAQFARR